MGKSMCKCEQELRSDHSAVIHNNSFRSRESNLMPSISTPPVVVDLRGIFDFLPETAADLRLS